MVIIVRLLYKIIFPALLLSVVATFTCVAQKVYRPYELFTVNEGLPQNYILGLAQDSSGFIWVGTKDGLARYDGHSFKIYRHGRDSIHTPAGNHITNLYVDHHGFLWIQYEGHLIDRYNPTSGIFEHISSQASWNSFRSQLSDYELLVDRQDNLWLLTDTKGFYRYHVPSKKMTTFTGSVGVINDTARAILEDHSGKIWLVTQQGFSVVDQSKNGIANIPYDLSNRRTYSGRNYKLGVGETESGKIVVTSLDSTILIFNPVNSSFQSVVATAKRVAPYDAGLGNTNFIMPRGRDRWFTCNGKMFRIDNSTDVITETENPVPHSYPDVSALLIDRSGTLWFGKNAEGLCRINLNAPPFVSKKYTEPNFDTDILINELGIQKKDLPPGFDNSAFGYMFRKTTDTVNGLIWIQNYLMNAHQPRLMAYDVQARTLSTMDVPIAKYGEIGINTDHSGNIWSIGVNSWTPARVRYEHGVWDKQFVNLPSVQGDSMYAAGGVAINPVLDNDIMWVLESNMSIDFSVWRLASIQLKTKETRWYPLVPDNAEPSSSLLMMVNDPFNSKYLWIGTTGNGLLRFDKTTGNCHAFTTNDGLPNNTIYAIVPDQHNNLWLSSNRGLTRFNTNTNAVRNFDVTDGLISNEFNRWHYFDLPDGRIAFGGMNGYTVFRPGDIKDDEFQPQVLISDLLINNRSVPDSTNLIDSSINSIGKLVLPYDQNFLEFVFASDEYNAPQKISYRYRLSNFDNGWINANARSATYTKLPPGNYILEINATNTSGIWSNKIRRIHIVIIPPWWRTWWAYVVYIALIAALIASFFYYRLRRIRLAQEVFLQQKQTEQLKMIDEMKSRFFSNITHEFRTPLSLIISPVEKLHSESSDERTRKTLSGVQENAQRLLQLINQLLDLSKLEIGHAQLNFSRGRLDEFASEMVSLFAPLAERQQIELTCHCDLHEQYLFEADKLKTILFNLLSNSMKFTPAGGRVAVSVTGEGQMIRLEVSDTGIGIPADQLPFIFNRFFQADNSTSRMQEGTGIGLALVKELTMLMKGTVDAKSAPGAGTAIFVSIPMEKAINSKAPVWHKKAETGTATPATYNEEPTNTVERLPGKQLPQLLLVEDNDELLAFLRESFQHDFNVLTAANGAKAYRIAKEELPDIVITDVMMPEMDGYTLCRTLKGDPVTSHIAVILLSAKASYESRLSGLQLGADDYIAKPFHYEELRARVQNLLDHQEKLRLNYRSQLQTQEPGKEAGVPENPFLKSLYAVIDEMIDDSQLGASKLAERHAMSLRTLNRKLNALIGLTAGDLIRQYRLQKGLALLKSGLNVSETAYSVGFETPAYFSQCFKEQYGVSPKDYLLLPERPVSS